MDLQSLQSLQAEIRSDAELLKRQLAAEAALSSGEAPQDSIPALTPIAPVSLAEFQAHPRPEALADGSYRYRDLARFDDETFVEASYRALLRHAPDPEGLGNYTRMLRAGKHKAEVLARLRYSHEGRAQAVRLRGLLIPAAFAGLAYIPLLGRVLEWFVELVFLRSTLQRLRTANDQHRRHTNASLHALAKKSNEQSRALNRWIEGSGKASIQDSGTES
ncbi:MAG: hypothetical protein NXI24_14655 [bacterium]|nr:hypothetical protein [bacterium]